MTAVIVRHSFLLFLYSMIPLRKWLTLALLFFFFSVAAGNGELLKIPLLAFHYLEHRQEGYSGSFMAYVAGHYLDEDGRDEDADRDSSLPFCSGSPLPLSMVVSALPAGGYPIRAPRPPAARIYARLQLPHYGCNYNPAIWQPPRKPV